MAKAGRPRGPKPECGTLAGWDWHRRYGTDPCDVCEEEYRARCRERWNYYYQHPWLRIYRRAQIRARENRGSLPSPLGNRYRPDVLLLIDIAERTAKRKFEAMTEAQQELVIHTIQDKPMTAEEAILHVYEMMR